MFYLTKLPKENPGVDFLSSIVQRVYLVPETKTPGELFVFSFLHIYFRFGGGRRMKEVEAVTETAGYGYRIGKALSQTNDSLSESTEAFSRTASLFSSILSYLASAFKLAKIVNFFGTIFAFVTGYWNLPAIFEYLGFLDDALKLFKDYWSEIYPLLVEWRDFLLLVSIVLCLYTGWRWVSQLMLKIKTA